MYECSHNLPTIRRMAISIFVRRVIYLSIIIHHRANAETSCQSKAFKACFADKAIISIYIPTHTNKIKMHAHTHTVNWQWDTSYKNVQTSPLKSMSKFNHWFSFVYQKYTLSSRLLSVISIKGQKEHKMSLKELWHKVLFHWADPVGMQSFIKYHTKIKAVSEISWQYF